MTTSRDLMELVVATLKAPGATNARQRVYAPGDWPTWDNEYPAIKARVFGEDKVPLGHGSINFTTTTTIRLLVQVSAPAEMSDGGAGAAEDELWCLQRQIEVAIINSQPLTSLVQQFSSVRNQTEFSAEGEKHLGSMQIDIGLEFYQGVEDFAPIPADAIEVVQATVLSVEPSGPNTGIAIDLPQ